MEKKDIKIAGHRGKWYVIEEGFYNSKEVYLLEHQTLGEDVPCLIVDRNLNIIMDEVTDGLSELKNI